MVGPPLHHLDAFTKVLSTVVRTTDLVALDVGELPLDRVGIPAILVEHRACHRAKAVACHLVGRVTEATKSGVERVVTHGSRLRSDARKRVRPTASYWLNLAESLDSLT